MRLRWGRRDIGATITGPPDRPATGRIATHGPAATFRLAVGPIAPAEKLPRDAGTVGSARPPRPPRAFPRPPGPAAVAVTAGVDEPVDVEAARGFRTARPSVHRDGARMREGARMSGGCAAAVMLPHSSAQEYRRHPLITGQRSRARRYGSADAASSGPRGHDHPQIDGRRPPARPGVEPTSAPKTTCPPGC
jgi:hypothetical protein